MSDETDEFQRMQLEAFDEVAKRSPSLLVFGGKTAVVIASQVQSTRTLEDAGYDLTELSGIEIKRADFDAMKLADRSDVLLDGKPLRIVQIKSDASEPTLSLALWSQR